MNLFQLNDQESVVDSAQLRLICGSPHNNSWTLYRRLVGVEERSRLLTVRQAFLLWVTCNLYRNGRRQLKRIELYQVGDCLLSENPESVEMMRSLCGTDGIRGDALPQLIESWCGKSVSVRTIYRRCAKSKTVPKFSTTRTYTPAQVRRILSAMGDRISA